VSVILLAIGVLLLTIVFVLITWNRVGREESKGHIDLKIGGEELKLEVADTPALRSRGLMGRSSLGQNGGVLFVFDQSGIYPFWMKNTLIPLDIIWLDEKGQIVYMKENAEPCSGIVDAICRAILPGKIARYVIELNGGMVEKLGLQTGDLIELPKGDTH